MLTLAALILAPPATLEWINQDIVVTGRGLAPAPGSRAYGSIDIGREQLTHSASDRLEDILLAVPGFAQFRRSDARSANPTSQGATLRALGGNASSRALLTLDGVPQSDPFGGWISWPAYDPRRLANVRIVRGGGSGTDGPGALAGTIALESAGLDDLPRAQVSADAGSRHSLDLAAGGAVEAGAGWVSVWGSYARGDGFTPVVGRQQGLVDRPSPYRQASVAARAVFPVGATLELQTSISALQDDRERGTAFSAIDTKGLDAAIRLVGYGRTPFSALVYAQLRAFSNAFAAVSAERTSVSETLNQYQVPSEGLGARLEVRPQVGPLKFRLGIDGRETVGRTEETYQYVAGAPTRGRVAGGRTDVVGAFVEATADAGPLTLTASGRIDRWWISDGRLRERMFATGASLTDLSFADRQGWEPTGRAGIAWRARGWLSIRAAAYLGWRLPTLNELYRPFRLGADATAANPDLAPERLHGIEGGVDLRPLPHTRIGVTLFDNRLTDPIANVTFGQGPGTFPGVGFVAAGGAYRVRENLGSIASRGVEVDASLRMGRFDLSAGYAHSDARVTASGAAAPLNGLRPAQSPRDSASASLSWEKPGTLFLGLNAHYVSRQFEDDLNRTAIRAALTFDARGELSLSRRLTLVLRGENVTDEEVIAGISGAGILERATPRTLWVGFRWQG